MRHRRLIFGSALAVAAVAGCYTGPTIGPEVVPTVSTNPTDPGAADAAPREKTTGIPCDVSAVLLGSCSDCHGTLLLGTTQRLLTYEDLSAKTDDDPTETVAQLAVARMTSTDKPMPPDGLLGADKVAPLQAWIAAGLPRGSCGDDPGASTGDAAAPEPPADAGDAGDSSTPSVCTSNTFYDPDQGVENQSMDPGRKCVDCHSSNDAQPLFVGGTIYPTLHEPDECDGVGAGASVVIIDAAGTSHTLTTDAVGNFVKYSSFPVPYRAMVVKDSRTVWMNTPQTDGDCNGCHSESGDNGAAGRIQAP
jgi:hypothetical protein